MGDVLLLYVALFASLFVRYSFNISSDILRVHIVPFSILFVLWILVFLIGGLYEKHIRVHKNRLPSTILKVQIINSLLAVVFFYSIPAFGIAPKTTLFIYLIISFLLISIWRVYGPLLFGNNADQALFIASGAELAELTRELKMYKGYPLTVADSIDLDSESDIVATLRKKIDSHPNVRIIVADLENQKMNVALSYVYELMQKRYIYLEIHSVYEDVFNRLPVSLLDERWLIQNISLLPSKTYDVLKRALDIVVGSIAFVVSLPFYVLAYVLIKLDDAGPLFFTHERVGQNGKLVTIVKFRSYGVHYEKDGMAKEQRITRVGAFLRRSRIDELPQLWNLIRGDLSLIGPRSEIPKLVHVYEQEIPYYSLRHMVKPGLSGWAQINQKDPPKFSAEVDKTKQKVAYDLFYIKHRSFLLDLFIGLQTIRELLSRRGI